MRHRAVAALLALAAMAGPLLESSASSADTLDTVRERGFLICAVETTGLGLTHFTEEGIWDGFFPDYCRAIAAATLGDAQAAEFIPVDVPTRFEAVRSGAADVLVSASTWTLGRDAGLGIEFPAIYLYDGQGFAAHRSLGAVRLSDVGKATLCVQGSGTTTERNLIDLMIKRDTELTLLVTESYDGAFGAFFGRRCDLITSDRTQLAATLAQRAANRSDYVLLSDTVSKEPLAPVVRDDDQTWTEIVRWVVYAIVAAEELGITRDSAVSMRGHEDPAVRRLLGDDPGLGETLGLDSEWAFRIIHQVGNYGEIFESHLGPDTPIGFSRGLNALWRDGGLLYAPPLR